jgi:hypothetical protein
MNTEQLISTAGWSKLDFGETDKCQPVLLRLSLAGNLEKKTLMSLDGTEWRERGYRLGARVLKKPYGGT